MNTIIRTVLAVSALSTIACQPISSADVSTHELTAHIQVVEDGSGYAYLSTQLSGGPSGRTGVDLVGGDVLEANHGRYSAAMDPENSFHWGTYSTELPVDRAALEYQVSFIRPYGPSAPDSWVEMPAPFELLTPQPEVVYGLDALHLEWTNLGRDAMYLHVDGSCIYDYDSPILDEGGLALDTLALDLRPSPVGGPCYLNVEISRTADGSLDPAFHSGQVTATQIRTATVVLYQ